jgi:hypothetical protein
MCESPTDPGDGHGAFPFLWVIRRTTTAAREWCPRLRISAWTWQPSRRRLPHPAIINAPTIDRPIVPPQLAALGELLIAAGCRFATTIFLVADELIAKSSLMADGARHLAAWPNSIIVSYSKDLCRPAASVIWPHRDARKSPAAAGLPTASWAVMPRSMQRWRSCGGGGHTHLRPPPRAFLPAPAEAG